MVVFALAFSADEDREGGHPEALDLLFTWPHDELSPILYRFRVQPQLMILFSAVNAFWSNWSLMVMSAVKQPCLTIQRVFVENTSPWSSTAIDDVADGGGVECVANWRNLVLLLLLCGNWKIG